MITFNRAYQIIDGSDGLLWRRHVLVRGWEEFDTGALFPEVWVEFATEDLGEGPGVTEGHRARVRLMIDGWHAWGEVGTVYEKEKAAYADAYRGAKDTMDRMEAGEFFVMNAVRDVCGEIRASRARAGAGG